MKVKNWEEVTAASKSKRLPVGGYVCRIIAVENDERKERLEVTYEIAEGQYAGFYENAESWKHQFRVSYSDKGETFFKAFLDALVASNPKFSIKKWQAKSDEQEFVGLTFGGLFQTVWKESERSGWIAVTKCRDQVGADIVRKGTFTLPAIEWESGGKYLKEPPSNFVDPNAPTKAEQPKLSESVYDGDIPF